MALRVSALSLCRESPGMAAALGLLSLTHLWEAKEDAAALALSCAPTSPWVAGMLPSV